MRYIDDLIKVSNNEDEFKKELLKIKECLNKAPNLSRETKLFANNLNKYCNKYTSEFSEDGAYVLPINNYCMFILNNGLNYIKKQNQINQEIFKGSCGIGKVPKEYQEKYNEVYINSIINHMDLEFFGNDSFYFNELKDLEYLNMIKFVLKNLNLNIINDLIGIKPTIFIGENHYMQDSTSTYLGVLTLMLNTYHKPPALVQLVDRLVRDCMEILFNITLEQKDIDFLCKKYRAINSEKLNQFIGSELATYMCYGEKSKVIDEVLEITKERNSIDYKIQKHMNSLWIKESFKI